MKKNPSNRSEDSRSVNSSTDAGEEFVESKQKKSVNDRTNMKPSLVPSKKRRLADLISVSSKKLKPVGLSLGLGLAGRLTAQGLDHVAGLEEHSVPFIKKENYGSSSAKFESDLTQIRGVNLSPDLPVKKFKTKDLSNLKKKQVPKVNKLDAGLHVNNQNGQSKYSKSENQDVKPIKSGKPRPTKVKKPKAALGLGMPSRNSPSASSGRHAGTNPTTGLPKPDWTAIKKQKKEIKLARKQKRSTYIITVEGKHLWEVLRNQNNGPTSAADLKEGIVKMHNLLKTHLDKLVMCHDMSRVVQWLIKMATPEIRLAIIEELTPFVKKMIVDRYASKCLGSLLKHGSKESGIVVVDSCMGLIVKLMSNVVSHGIVEKAYAEYATNDQKRKIHSEFYSDLYKSSKDSNVTCLADTYKNTPDLKNAILASAKANIMRVLNKNSATNQSTLLYTVLLEFLRECTKEDRDEILSIVRTWISDLPNNKEAGQVGMMCVWYATNKEKKAMVKSLKGNVVKIAQSKHLQIILLAVFSLVDDTVLLTKILVPEIISNLKELGGHDIGRKLIVHLISYGDARFFHPIEMKVLKEGEASSLAKKDPEVKRQEILRAVSKQFLKSVAEEPEFWFNSTDRSLTAFAILTGAENGDDKQKAFVAVSKLLMDPTATSLEEVSTSGKAKRKKNAKNVTTTTETIKETKPVPLVSHCAIHHLLGLLIKENSFFVEVLTGELTSDAVEYWVPHNRGCFNLLHLLEAGNEIVATKIKGLLKSHKSLLNSSTSVGAKILISKLNGMAHPDKN